jgi:hypothetical protein
MTGSEFANAPLLLSPPLRKCPLHRANFAGPTGHVRRGGDSRPHNAHAEINSTSMASGREQFSNRNSNSGRGNMD